MGTRETHPTAKIRASYRGIRTPHSLTKHARNLRVTCAKYGGNSVVTASP